MADSRTYLTNLFAGDMPGHAIIMSPPVQPQPEPGDVTTSPRPVGDWLDRGLRTYEAQVAYHEATGDDSVPYAPIQTGTQLLAAAFGCPVHVYEDSNPCALPLVETAKEADELGVPGVEEGPLGRALEYGRLLADRLGPDVPIGVPDIQSPFDIAALIWRKERMYLAIMDEPDAVRRLVAKCQRLLEAFIDRFLEEFAQANLCHCPQAWAPPELGIWLSEDEAGAMSTPMFEEFCLPSLDLLSRRYGGMFLHCCADADHQHESFRRIPNLRAMNRVFTGPPQDTIRDFTPGTVLMVAWTGLEGCLDLLSMAEPGTRFLFNMPEEPLEDARRTHDRLREACLTHASMAP
jgi:hypothetical protein